MVLKWSTLLLTIQVLVQENNLPGHEICTVPQNGAAVHRQRCWCPGFNPSAFLVSNTFGTFWSNLIQGARGEVDQVWEVAAKSSAEDHADRYAKEKQQSCADPEGDGQCLPQEPAAQVCFQ